MLKLKRVKFNKIGAFLKKLPWILGESAFSTFLFFLFLGLILGAFLFYQYSFLVQRITPEITEKPLKFEEKIHQEVLKIWQEKAKRFEEIDSKQYPDLFR